MEIRRTMYTTPLVPALLFIAIAIAGCSGISVGSDYEPGTDFAAFETYAWVPQEPTERVDELLIERIRRAVDNQLLAKGMRRVETEDASLLVTHRVAVAEKMQINDPYFSFDRYQRYEEGTLMINLVDAKADRVVWRGTGQTRITVLKTPDEREARINEVVSAIFAQYPPSS